MMFECAPHGTKIQIEPWNMPPVVLKAINEAHLGHKIVAYYETHLHGFWNGERYIELPESPASFGRAEAECETCEESGIGKETEK